MIDGLLAPVDTLRTHGVGSYLSWHGYDGSGLGGWCLAGLLLVLNAPVAAPSVTPSVWLHHGLGWTVLTLAASQCASAWLRGTKGGPTSPAPNVSLRGDHFDMTPRRYVVEDLHKFGGLLAIFLSLNGIVTGMWQANASCWMWPVLIVWWVC
jgi:hypothetical protein